MAEPKVFVSPPVRKPRKGGIKSVVGEFVSTARLGAANAIQWISDGCEFPKAAPGLCYSPVPVTGDKEFDGIDHGSGPIFGLYQGVKCFLGPDADYDARARQLLEQGEARGVEEVLWEYANSAGGTGPAQTSWPAVIGQMEEAADTLYVGQPVIMLSRFAAVQARAAKALFGDEETGRLWTANGTPVIASAAASDTVAVVMGWPTVYASDVTVVTVIDHAVNQQMALAERIYALAIDCEWALHYAVNIPAGAARCVYTKVTQTLPAAEITYTREGDVVTVHVVPRATGSYTGTAPWAPTQGVQISTGSNSFILAKTTGALSGGNSTGTPSYDLVYQAVPDPNCTGGTPGQQDPGDELQMVLGSIPSSPIPDGTDVTAVVQTNQAVTEDIEVWYSLNGGPDTLAGVATQVDTLQFVFNADESITVTGDSVEVWAVTTFDGSPVESNRITIEVT